MATGRLGHSTRIKDLVRALQKLGLSRTLQGTESQQRRQAHTIATGSENAAALRAIADVGINRLLNVDEKIKQIRAMVADTLQSLQVDDYVKAHEIDELMRTLQELLGTPDLDVIYGDVTDQVLDILEGALENLAAMAFTTTANPLDHLRRRVRLIIVKFRHGEGEFEVDLACDRINVAIGWQCCILGLPEDALPDLTTTINAVHTLLEKTQKQLAQTI